MQSMSQDAHIKGKKVNHSLRATSMFTEVPGKLIKSVSGHKSSQALQVYERQTAGCVEGADSPAFRVQPW